MIFDSPWMFLLAIPIAVVLLIEWRCRDANALEFSSMRSILATGMTWRQRLVWLPTLLGVVAIVLLVLGAARPQVEVLERSREKEGIAIEMLVDISSSMDMRMDFKGKEATRLAVAKTVLEEFVAGDGNELKGRPDDLIGIITFARYADTVCPLTLGHEAVVYFARNLEINDRPNEDGTAYGDAASLAAARMKTLEENLWQDALEEEDDLSIKSKIIVLLTDGENNCGRHLPLEAAAMAKKWDIRVYTISLGEPPPPVRIEGEKGDEIQVVAERSAAEQTLEKMAEETGGIFRTAHDYDSLQAVYKEIDELERSEMRSSVKKMRAEVFGIFVGTALVLLVLESILRSTWLRRIP